MNNAQSAEIVAILHGAYPGIYLDEAVVEVWTNVMSSVDYDVAKQAVSEWVSKETKFPTVAEITGTIRRIRDVNSPPALSYRQTIADRDTAQAAFAAGYERARTEAGDTREQIDEKLDGYLNNWANITGPNRRAIDEERRSRGRSVRWADGP